MLDKLEILYIGNICTIRAVISSNWRLSVDVPDEVYEKYRSLFYASSAEAKNYLLDHLCFDGYPFSRGSFNFVEAGKPLSENAVNWLEAFERSLH